MKLEFNIDLKYKHLFCNLFAAVFKLDRNIVTVSATGSIRISSTKTISGDIDIAETRFINWVEASIMILHKLAKKEEEISEFSHCLMKAIDKSYDNFTLLPEQYLMMLYNKLPDVDKKLTLSGEEAPTIPNIAPNKEIKEEKRGEVKSSVKN